MKYDYHIADNSDAPHSVVYAVDSGRTIATFDADEFDLDTAERVAELLNEMAVGVKVQNQ